MAQKQMLKEVESGEDTVIAFNSHYYKDAFAWNFKTASFKREHLLLRPGLFFDDEFKTRVLRYAPPIIPGIEGTIFGADFKHEMSVAEAFARALDRCLTPAQFLAILRAILDSDARTKNDAKKVLRYDGEEGENLFCIRARGEHVLAWVATGHYSDHFRGIGVFGFGSVPTLLGESDPIEFEKARLFV